MTYKVVIGSREYTLDLPETITGHMAFRVDESAFEIDVAQVDPTTFSVLHNGRSWVFQVVRRRDQRLELLCGSERIDAGVFDSRHLSRQRGSAHEEGRIAITSPMSGRVVRLLVKKGDPVEPGQGVAVIEAMKMQNELPSPKRGQVIALHVAEGGSVSAGDLIAEVE